MKTLVRPILLVAMICVLIVSISACDKNKPLADQEKALIDKSVFDKQHLTKSEETEVQRLITENKYAEEYWSQKKHEFSMKDWSKPLTTKPSKEFP
jgi:hypothetical protein